MLLDFVKWDQTGVSHANTQHLLRNRHPNVLYDHPPPHFHAIYGEHEAKIGIETLERIEGKLPRRALGLASTGPNFIGRSGATIGSGVGSTTRSSRSHRWSRRMNRIVRVSAGWDTLFKCCLTMGEAEEVDRPEDLFGLVLQLLPRSASVRRGSGRRVWRGTPAQREDAC